MLARVCNHQQPLMLEELKAFVAVVDKTSLTKAADALALTQSAVSRRVQQLEQALGATLLDRSSRPPKVTAVGRRIYHSATTLMRDLDQLKGIAKHDEEPSGTFRLGLPQVVADVALFDIALRMKAKFPRIDLKCRTNWSTGLQLELASGKLDAAVVMAPAAGAAGTGMHGRRLAKLDVRVVQSKLHPVVPKRSRIAELADHEWILNPQGCGYRAALQRAMESAGKQLRLGVDMHGTETQLRLVAAGLGLGLAPRSLLAASSHAKALSLIDVVDFSLQIDVWMVHAADLGNLSRALDVLRQTLDKAFNRRSRVAPASDAARRSRPGVSHVRKQRANGVSPKPRAPY